MATAHSEMPEEQILDSKVPDLQLIPTNDSGLTRDSGADVTETPDAAGGGPARSSSSESDSSSSSSDSEQRGSAAACVRAGTAVAKAEQSGGAAPSRKPVRRPTRRRPDAGRQGSSSSSSSDSSSGSSSSSGARGRRRAKAESSSDDEAEDTEPSDLSGEEEVDQEAEAGAGALKDLVVKADPVPVDPTYRGDWTGAPLPGNKGFNLFAAKAMHRAGLSAKKLQARPPAAAPGACPALQPHQEAVGFLLHPSSPVSRLLVDHPTGSGKTREMIRVLDNFFLDPRPKVPIFPKEPVCRNFYAELLRWPSQYRDFFACVRPQDAARAAGVQDWRSRRGHLWDLAELPDAELRAICALLQEVLEMKGWFYMGKMRKSRKEAFQKRFPEEKMPGGPLRALRYTSAGGQHTELRHGRPVSALMKVAFDYEGKNVYSNKIVIMDEAHNLVRTQTQYGRQLERLRELLVGARGMVLAGFTGTPILNEPHEGRQLLDIIKGRGAPRCDEGFLSSFPMRPAGLFPQSLPRGAPDSVLTPKLRRQLVRRSALQGEPLQRYDAKRHKGLPERRLQRYCNLCVHFGSLHDGKNGSRARVLANMKACAPKLAAIAADVAERPEKALVLVARHSGMEALLEHLRGVAKSNNPPFGVATMDELGAFNSQGNRRGEQYRVLVADALTCSEGVSFFAVRRVHLADVPAAPSGFIQSVGRAIRMYGHRGLPEEEQTVTTILHVAGFPRWMRSPLGVWAFRAQRCRADPRGMESRAKRLLRRLLKVGINNLDVLKARIDACGRRALVLPSQGESRREPVGPNEIATFLEQLGLWDEAKALKAKGKAGLAAKQRKKAKAKAPAAAAAASRPVATPQAPAGSPRRGQAGGSEDGARLAELALSPLSSVRRQQQPAAMEIGTAAGAALQNGGSPKAGGPRKSRSSADLAAAPAAKVPRQASGLDAASPAHGRPQPRAAGESPKAGGGVPPASANAVGGAAEKTAGTEPSWRRDPLAAALADLQQAASAAEAAAQLRLSPWTADEEALKQLAQRSREFVPALAALRRQAVDRLILKGLAGEAPQECSEGESSVHEFGVSASSGEEAATAKTRAKEHPLMLPPGWRTETTRRGKKGRECREFVDPAGRRYRTVREAKVAVDKARSAENLARQLKSKYEATLLKKAQGEREAVKVEVEPVKREAAAPTAKLEQLVPGEAKVKREPIDLDGTSAAVSLPPVGPVDLEVKREHLDLQGATAAPSLPPVGPADLEDAATPTRRSMTPLGTTPETAPPKRRLDAATASAQLAEGPDVAELPQRKRQSLAQVEASDAGKTGDEAIVPPVALRV